MPVNFTGTYAAIRAFVPVLIANGGGHIVNVLSLLSLASTPPMAGYSASKAAAHSLTQELRPVLAAQGISVHGVYPGGIDTDMFAGVDAPKTPPAAVVASLLDGLADDLDDIFPDPNAEAMAGPLADRPEGVQARLLRRRGSLARQLAGPLPGAELRQEPLAQRWREGLFARQLAGDADRLADLVDVRDAAGAVREVVLEPAALLRGQRVLDVVGDVLDDVPAAELSVHGPSLVPRVPRVRRLGRAV